MRGRAPRRLGRARRWPRNQRRTVPLAVAPFYPKSSEIELKLLEDARVPGNYPRAVLWKLYRSARGLP